jgi:hypothetical protein
MPIKRTKKAAPKKKRNIHYTIAKARKICVRIAKGESLRKIVLDEKMPSMPTVFEWLSRHEEFRDLYATARAAMADAFFEEFLDDLDDVKAGKMSAQVGKVVLDGKKWVMAKLNCPKYGEKQQVSLSNPDGKPFQVVQQIAAMDLASLEEAIKKAEKLVCHNQVPMLDMPKSDID